MTFEWAAFSHNGSKKPCNEDNMVVFASGLAGAERLPAVGRYSIDQQDLIFAVSDGMGGGHAGDVASAAILKSMSEMIPQTFKAAATGFYPDSLTHLSAAILTIHEQMNATAAIQKTMAATLALTWFTPENLYLANVGDTRIYLARKGDFSQISHDHCHAWSQWKRHEISEIQYRTHPRRPILYQVIGAGRPGLYPHLASIAYQPGDRFLICSDGLIDGLWERHLSDALNTTQKSPEEIATTLLKRAVDNSGFDDTTLIVISVSQV